ncbi:hypothetical protein CPC08DRAFT_216227 [Agrocybe pediades]|nr:hypothetical protein CPC08DRAFT_216227 [Agrocybe pediades]
MRSRSATITNRDIVRGRKEGALSPPPSSSQQQGPPSVVVRLPTPKGKEKEVDGGSSWQQQQQQRTHQHHEPERRLTYEEIQRLRKAEARRKAEESRGEWIVLDLGSDHTYHSILRIFHRYFEMAEESNFVPPSQRPLYPSSSSRAGPPAGMASPTGSHSQHPSSVTSSSMNSPVAPGFLSPPHLAGGTLPSQLSQSYADDDEEMYVEFDAEHPPAAAQAQAQAPAATTTTKPSRSQPIHPSVFTKRKPRKPHSADPALRYPEWRLEVVQRAMMHGMRDAGRPADVLMNGKMCDVGDMDILSKTYRRQRKKDEEDKRSLRQSFVGGEGVVVGVGGGGSAGGSGDGGGDEKEDDFEKVEEGGGEVGREEEKEDEVEVEEGKRASRGSTLNAAKMNADAHADTHSVHYHGSAPEDNDDHDNDNVLTESGSAIDVLEDNEYDPEEEGEVDLDSFDDSEEESETEWVAWVTDLPRQAHSRIVQRQRDEEKEKERQKVEMLRTMKYVPPESQQLSPMIFSNPFSDSAPSLVESPSPNTTIHPTTTSLSLHHSLPILTPAEERQLFLEERKSLEPHAFLASPLPSSGRGYTSGNSVSTLQASSLNNRPSQTVVHLQKKTVVHHPALNLFHRPKNNEDESPTVSNTSSRYLPSHKTLSSQSSVESLLGHLDTTATSTSSINLSSRRTRHYPHSNPISPLANMDLAYSRPVPDDEEIDDYPITGRKTHRLQHSTSMPLVTRGGSRSIPVHSVPSSPPRSPAVTSSTSTTTTSPASAAVSPTSQLAEFDPANLVGKPILSPEEIAQLERDAEMGIPYSFPQYPPPPSMRIDTSTTPAAPSTSASAVPSSPSTTYGLIEGSSVIALSPPPLAHSRLTSPDRVAAAANLRKKLSGMSIAESVSSRRSGSGLSGATGSGSNDEVATGSSAPATTGRLTGAPRQRPKLSLAGLGSSAAATASSSSELFSASAAPSYTSAAAGDQKPNDEHQCECAS